MKKKQVAVKIMKHLVTHDGNNGHGYSQYSRQGDGKGYCTVKIDGKDYKIRTGDRDCSSAIIDAFVTAGISCGGATYTGNMRSCMVKTGNFKWHPMSSGYVAKAGDVYLNEACHTAMCLSANPDRLMEFSISENGTIDGKEGDQTGWESHTCAYYSYPWDGILECINNEDVKGTPSAAKPKDTSGIIFTYAVQLTDGTTLKAVQNLKDYAGIIGKKIANIAIKVNKGKIKYRVHVLDGKWLPWVTGYNFRDHKNGYAGNRKAIDAIQIVYTAPDGTRKKVKYRVSPVKGDYYSWQTGTEKTDGQDGYAGSYGKAIDRLQITVK